MVTDTRDGMDILIDYIIQVASRKPKLLNFRARSATLEEAFDGDHLIVDNAGQAKLSVLIAEALQQMSEDMHEADDRAVSSGPLTKSQAMVLIKQYGGLRPASRATGICRMKLSRALKEVEDPEEVAA